MKLIPRMVAHRCLDCPTMLRGRHFRCKDCRRAYDKTTSKIVRLMRRARYDRNSIRETIT